MSRRCTGRKRANLAPYRPRRVFHTVCCEDGGKVGGGGSVFQIAEKHLRLTSTLPSLEWLIDASLGIDVTSQRLQSVSIRRGKFQQIEGFSPLWGRFFEGSGRYERWLGLGVPFWNPKLGESGREGIKPLRGIPRER